MSEVHRYKVVKMLSEVGNRIGYSPHGPEVVLASDYDSLLAERDQLKAENEQLRAKLEKIRDRPCSVHGATADSVIPNALDAWGRPVPQYLPYDFSGNPGASATQYCNGWNDAGGYWKNHCIGLEQKLAGFSSDQKNSDSQETISHA